MADLSRGRRPATIKGAIEELGNLLSASNTGECTGKLKLIISDLKNKLLRTSNGANEFVELGGLRELVNVTKLCGCIKDSILGTAIGCLANVCALSKDARTKIASDDLTWFATLLKNTTSTKIFNCLARLIGNIAKDPENVLALQESQALPELAKGLTMCEDIDCKQSIIRALNILARHKHCRKIIYDSEGFSGLLQCLKYEDAKVTTAALVATESFISSKEPEFGTELCANGGMLAVVKLMNEQSKCFKPSLNIISICVGMPECRGDLGTSGAIEALIKLSNDPQYTSYLPRMLVILCTTCNDVISRQKMKDFGGLELLIDKLSDCEYMRLHTNILSAITHYYFDESTIRYMVERLDLHKTLVNCLSTANTSNKSSVHSSEDEMSVCDPYSNMLASPSSTASRSSTPASVQDDLSRDQISSFPPNLAVLSYKAQNSLALELSTSPTSTEENEKLAASFLSDDLSLNTSSSSMLSSSKKKQPLHIDINNTIHTPPNLVESILSSPQAYKSPLIHSPTDCYSYSSSYQVSLLLSRISLISQCQEFLASSETIIPILKHLCMPVPESSYCFKILHRVLKNPKCFEKAILASAPSFIWRDMCTLPWSEEERTLQTCSENPQYISLESEERNVSDQKMFYLYFIKILHCVNVPPQLEQGCTQALVNYSTSLQYRGADLLSTLSKVAESPYGTGVLSSMLLRGGCREKEACVSAIPFMCHSVQIVRRLMLDYGGLDILIDTVSNSDDSTVQQTAISSLVFLLQSVRSQSSSQHNYSKHVDVKSLECQYVSSSGDSFDVEILVCPSGVDKCYKFSAHRELLAKLSDVFAAMLGGSFAESKSGRIVLKGVSAHAFLAILHHLYGCSQHCKQLQQGLDSLDSIWFDTTNSEVNDPSLNVDSIPSSCLEHDNLLSCIFPNKQEETEKNCYKEARQCLETLACANQFLLTDLCTECEERICECLPLDSSDIDLPSLFAYCQMHEAKIIPPFVLDYIMLRLSKPSLCSKLFGEILVGPSGHAALQSMKSSIINAIRK